MPRALTFASLAALSGLTLGLASVQRPRPDPSVRVGFDAITIPSAKATLSYLAGPETQGRGTGQPGYDRAAEYMARRFREIGLKPLPPREGAGLDGYSQRAPFFRVSLASAKVAGPKGALGVADVGLVTSNADVDVSGEGRVVSLDGTAKLDDVTALAGKIVIVPNANPSRRAMSQLAGSDAKAVLLVVGEIGANAPLGRQTKPVLLRVPTLRVRRGALARVLGVAPDRLATMGATPTLTVTVKTRVEPITVSNVVAMIPGSDPVLKDEFVGIGAHLDHLGVQNGVVYPGADDDGSGSTALIEVAKAFARNPVKPKRTIVFMAFFGEEMGLLGSRHLTDHPPVDLDRMVAELQMDMVGRDSDGVQNGDAKRVDRAGENTDTLRLVGSKRISTALDDIIQAQNAHLGFRFKDDAEDVYGRSDHYNFAKRGIPIAFFFDGFHPDYHRPTDTIEKINWTKLTNTARLVYLTAMQVANRAEVLPKDAGQQ